MTVQLLMLTFLLFIAKRINIDERETCSNVGVNHNPLTILTVVIMLPSDIKHISTTSIKHVWLYIKGINYNMISELATLPMAFMKYSVSEVS